MDQSGLGLTNLQNRVSLLGWHDENVADADRESDSEDKKRKQDNLYGASSVDGFLQNIYTYFADHGYRFIITQALMTVLVSVFSTVLFAWLSLCVKWQHIFDCETSDTTHLANITRIHCSEVFGVSPELKSGQPSVMEVMFLLCIAVTSLYTLWEICAVIWTIRYARKTRHFYQSVLQINDEQLQDMSLDELVYQLIRKKTEGKVPALGDVADAKHILARIMRCENVFIALTQYKKEQLIPNNMSTSLYYALYSCIIHGLFNHDRTVNTTFLESPKILQRKLYRRMMMQIIVLPFLLCMTLMQAFFFNMHELYTDKAFSNPRRWTAYAQWKLRKINELSHTFHRRLEFASRACDKLLRLYPNYVMSQFNQGLTKIAGAIVSVLFILTVLNSPLLVTAKVAGITLIWYLTACATIVVISRNYIVPRRNKIENADQIKQDVCTHTGFNMASALELKHEVEALYRPKLTNIFYELIGQITTIRHLWNVNAQQIIDFLNANITRHPSAGAIYRGSLPWSIEEGLPADDLSLSVDADDLQDEPVAPPLQPTRSELMTASNIDLMASFANVSVN